MPFYTKVKKRQLDMSRKCIEERKRLNNQSNYNKAKAKFIIKSMESLFLRGTGNVIN